MGSAQKEPEATPVDPAEQPDDAQRAFLARRYRLADGVVMRDVSSGLILVNLQSGGTWKLNATGAAVCRSLAEGATGEETLASLGPRFGVPRPTLTRDVLELLRALLAQGLVTAA